MVQLPKIRGLSLPYSRVAPPYSRVVKMQVAVRVAACILLSCPAFAYPLQTSTPSVATAELNAGVRLRREGKLPAAVERFQAAIRLAPRKELGRGQEEAVWSGFAIGGLDLIVIAIGNTNELQKRQRGFEIAQSDQGVRDATGSRKAARGKPGRPVRKSRSGGRR